jgi:hypothetical protein
VIAAATGLVATGGTAVGQTREVAPRASTATVAAAAPLSVHVTLSKHRVRIGHRLRVSYTWHDGNGDLVDTNHIGTMAMHVLRNVDCSRTGNASHPIGRQGSWWYTPQPEFTGAFTHAVKIKVGFNVRTGGCAPIEEATDTEIVKVLPAAAG